jgi:hypothetical protein
VSSVSWGNITAETDGYYENRDSCLLSDPYGEGGRTVKVAWVHAFGLLTPACKEQDVMALSGQRAGTGLSRTESLP